MLSSDVSEAGKGRYHYQTDETNSDVKSMETDQCVVRRAEQVGRDREVFVMDQATPFEQCSCEEDRAKDDGRDPPHGKCRHGPALPGLNSEVNRCAAPEQTDGEGLRDVEDLLRRWASEALAGVKEIRDDEDR